MLIPIHARISVNGTGSITTYTSQNIAAITDLGVGSYRFFFIQRPGNSHFGVFGNGIASGACLEVFTDSFETGIHPDYFEVTVTDLTASTSYDPTDLYMIVLGG